MSELIALYEIFGISKDRAEEVAKYLELLVNDNNDVDSMIDKSGLRFSGESCFKAFILGRVVEELILRKILKNYFTGKLSGYIDNFEDI